MHLARTATLLVTNILIMGAFASSAAAANAMHDLPVLDDLPALPDTERIWIPYCFSFPNWYLCSAVDTIYSVYRFVECLVLGC